MNIGIDLDGVLFDSEAMYRAYAQFLDLKHNGKGIIYPEELKAQVRYGWSGKILEEFVDGCVEIQKDAPLMPFAKKVVNAIAKKNKIYIITSRGALSEKEIEITKAALEREGLQFEDVVFSVLDKLEACERLNIDLMIDDFYDLAISLANGGIKCLYFRDSVLKRIEHENVTEVRNWGDVAVELVKMGIILRDDLGLK